ncbi:MAG: RidA family protein [Candidatus Eisenbacteria bacterium]
MRIEAELSKRGLKLPDIHKPPPGVHFSFEWVRVHGKTVYVSGHGPLKSDGSPLGPFGRVPSQVSIEDATGSARQAALSMLSSLKRELGDLDRVTSWLRVRGLVNADPGFSLMTNVINGFSGRILELYGPEAGRHARSAIGVAALPLNFPVVVEAIVAIDD